MFKVIIFFILISAVVPVTAVRAEADMTADLICPCECAMFISTCDCPTAMQIKKEIGSMKDTGFSEKQIVTALQAEYGNEILAHPEKSSSMSLWMGGISLAFISAVIGYIFIKKPNPGIIPDIKMYEQQFEEEYRKFVSEIDELDESISSFSKGSSETGE